MTRIATLLADAGGWDHMGGWGWPMAVAGWLTMVAVVGLVVWLIVTAARAKPGQSDRARNILDERYARGELDRDDYLRRKADLEEL